MSAALQLPTIWGAGSQQITWHVSAGSEQKRPAPENR